MLPDFGALGIVGAAPGIVPDIWGYILYAEPSFC